MINKVILLGNLGKDPEVKELPNGKVCNFSVATSRKWKDKSGEWQKETEWHNVTAFGSLAGVCEKYLRKGSKVYIEGRINTRTWENKEGVKQYSTGVIAEDLKMLDGASDRKPESAHDESDLAF